MLVVQTNFLKLAGMLPLSENKTSGMKVLSVILTLIALCLLTGSLFSTAFQGAIFFYGLVHPPHADNSKISSDLILLVMQELPFFTISGRAFFVLYFFFIRRRQWNSLMLDTSDFMRTCFPHVTVDGVVETMRKVNYLLCGVTIFLQMSWEVVDWYENFDGNNNFTMVSENLATPLPMTYDAYQSIIVWTLFSTLPFALSQQIYLCIIILAIVLGKGVERLICQINEEASYYTERLKKLVRITEKEIEVTDEKVRNWEVFHMQTLLFCESLNQFFSLILFAIYGIDLMTVLGFTSDLINNQKSDVTANLHLILSILIFFLYGTVFLLPLVLVHEKVNINNN
jgi:hypothetical protein